MTSQEEKTYLTSLAITIDSEDTKEIDDAISFDMIEGNYLLGVHITDLGSYIPKDSLLDKVANQRISTVYLETGEIPNASS